MASDLHPTTIKHIKTTTALHRHCGCAKTKFGRSVCAYHDAFNDGVAAMQEQLDEAVRLLREASSNWRPAHIGAFLARIDGGEPTHGDPAEAYEDDGGEKP